jgi:DNA modification methylase
MTYRKRVEIGLHVLFLGDCREVLPTVEASVCVTDPPYGCAATTGWCGKYDGFEIEGDGDTSIRDWLCTTWKGPMLMFGSPRIPAPPCRAKLIWRKGEHTGMGDLSFPWKPDYEEVYVMGEGWHGARTTSVLSWTALTSSARNHPTEKPWELMHALIGKAPEGAVIDPFMGIGTTGVACAKLGRRFIGIEIHEPYFDIACRRIKDAVNGGVQREIFAESAP